MTLPGDPRPPAAGLSVLVKHAHDLLVVGVDAEKASLLDAYRRHISDRDEPPDVVLAGTAHLDYADPDFAALNAPALVPSYATGSPHTRAFTMIQTP